MEHSLNYAEVNRYHPPTHVAKHLIEHAIRNIPNKQILLDKIYAKQQNQLGVLKAHEYNDSGKLQSVY